MTKKIYVLKTRCNEEEYQAAQARADQEGMNLSAYLRCAVARDAEAERLERVVAEAVRQQLAQQRQPQRSSDEQERLLQKLALIVEELAQDRNPQILMRVNQRMAAFGREEVM